MQWGAEMAVVHKTKAHGNADLRVDLERHQQIRQALKAQGYSISDIARELGRSPSTVTTVSQGYRRSAPIEAHLAMRLDTTPEVLFSERYTEEDLP